MGLRDFAIATERKFEQTGVSPTQVALRAAFEQIKGDVQTLCGPSLRAPSIPGEDRHFNRPNH